MSPSPRSIRQEQRDLATDLRGRQLTWSQVASEFSGRYGVNMRTALRMVHDWSQRDAADQWNDRWPADPKTFKNFSYWELWPGPTGHAPSLDVLRKLAEMYECSVADLVSDIGDFRERDRAHRTNRQIATLPEIVDPSASLTGRSSTELQNLIAQLERMDVYELAQLTAQWSEQLGADANRRALLLKLSAGLSLAAASPVSVGEELSSTPQVSKGSGEFAGIWHSRYVYPRTGRGDDFTGVHYIVFHQHASRIVGQSLPHTTGSQLRLELSVNLPVVTGTWRENTSPNGYYRGASYHGTLQMIAGPSGRKMHGMWLGFGRNFTINSGKWELIWQDSSTAKSVQRDYHLKA